MRNILRLLATLSVAIQLAGCGTFLKYSVDPIVNANFPPIDITAERNAAIAAATSALEQVKNPGLLLNVDSKLANDQLLGALRQFDSKDITVEASEITLGQQSLVFTANITGDLQAEGVRFGARISGEAVIEVPANGIGSVKPIFTSARLTKLVLTHSTLATAPLAKLINSALTRYLNNINGAIPRIQFSIEPDKIGLKTQPTTIELPGGRKINLPGASLGSTAVLIAPSGIHVISEIELRPGRHLMPLAAITFDEYANRFSSAANTEFGNDSLKKSGLFLSDRLLKSVLVNGFPPVPLSDLQRLALSDLQQAFGSTRNVAAGIYLNKTFLTKYIENVLQPPLSKFSNSELQIGPIAARLDEQTVIIEAPVNGLISNNVSYSARLTLAGILFPKAGGGISVRLAIAGITLDHVEHIGNTIAPLAFMTSINKLVDQLVPYANGFFAENPISLSIPNIDNLNLPSTSGLTISPSNLKGLASKPLTVLPRIRADGIRFLIVEAESSEQGDPTKLDARAQAFTNNMQAVIESAFDSNSRLALPPPLPIPPNSENIDKKFDQLWARSNLADSTNSEIGGSISLSWLSGKIGRAVSENSVSISAIYEASVDAPPSPMTKPDPISVTCDIGNCTRPSCPPRGSCSRDACDWDCMRCINVGFGNMCADEPSCLAGEFACNTREEAKLGACNTSEEIKLGACNVAAEGKLAACNLERNFKLAACNLTQEFANSINGLANLGDLGISSRIQAKATVNNLNVRYDNSSDSLLLNANAVIEVQSNGALNYDPKGIGYVLVCPIGGQITYSVSGTFGNGNRPLNAKIRPLNINDTNNLQLEFQISPIRVVGNINPAPFEAIFVQNPQIQVTCSPFISGVVNTIAILGKISAFTPVDIVNIIESQFPKLGPQERAVIDIATKGRVDQNIVVPPFPFSISRFPLKLGDMEYILTPRWINDSLILSQ